MKLVTHRQQEKSNEKGEGVKRGATRFMPIKTHLICRTHGFKYLIASKSSATR